MQACAMTRKIALKKKLRGILEKRQGVVQVGRYALVACAYCRKLFRRRHLTLDHVVQRRLGGTLTDENVVLCCEPCNTKREVARTDKNLRFIRKLSLISLAQSVRL